MTLLPDWAPNIHPLVVHFPIALLVIAVLMLIVRLFRPDAVWLQHTVLLLLWAGTLGLVAAFLTGKQAIDSVSIPGTAITDAASHEDWALYTLLFFSVLTLIQTALWWRSADLGRPVTSVLSIAGLIGIGMLWHTAEQGAQLVFKHGVGVQAMQEKEANLEDLEQRLRSFQIQEAAPQIEADGSWTWHITDGSAESLKRDFSWLPDLPADMNAEVIDDENGESHISLEISGQWLLLIPEAAGNIEGIASLNLNEFDGKVGLVHHVRDMEHYQYLTFNGSKLTQGRFIDGNEELLQTETFDTSGWFELKVMASGRHFYGYINDETVTHNHGSPMEAGKTGLWVDGEGILKIKKVDFYAL